MTEREIAASALRADIYTLFSTSVGTAQLTEALLGMLTRAIEDAYNQGRVDERKSHE